MLETEYLSLSFISSVTCFRYAQSDDYLTDTDKKKLRKHNLTMCPREAYKTFCDLYSDEERTKVIGFSTFCDLRPKDVLVTWKYPGRSMQIRRPFLKT